MRRIYRSSGCADGTTKVIFSAVLLSMTFLGTGRTAAQNVVVDSESQGYPRFGRFVDVASRRAHGGRTLVAVPGVASAYRFSVQLPRSGYYRLYAWWPESPGRESRATYSILHLSGQATVVEDQRSRGGRWNALGSYLFGSSIPAEVEVASAGRAPVRIDALRFVYAGSRRPGLRIETTAFPMGGLGEPFHEELQASGGSPPYRWFGFGNVPSGLRVVESGAIEGRPWEEGRFELQLLVQDGEGAVARRDLALDIEASPGAFREALGSGATDVIGRASSEPPAEGDLTELLDTVRSLEEGSWLLANENFYYDVWTPADLRPLKGEYSNPPPFRIIRAWASFAWDTRRGDLILYGGGHANYTGNDVYRWRGSTRRWERASLPSEVTEDDLGNFMAIDGPDAAPASAHTYDNSVYLRVADRYLTYGGAANPHGGAYLRQVDATTSRPTGPYLFDPSKADGNKVGGTTGSHVQRVATFPEIVGGNMWENRDIYANIQGSPTLPMNFVNGATAYYEEDGKDVVLVNAKTGGSARHVFKHTIHDIDDPTKDTWEHVGAYRGGFGGKGSGAYDPVLNVFVRTGNSVFTYWDLNTPGPRNDNVLFTPEDPSGQFFLDGYYGMDYDPVRRQFLLWRGTGDVWALKAPSTVSPIGWTIEKQPDPTSAVPNGSIGTGVLGKWKYIPNLDAFLGLEDPHEGNIWIYKPVGWTPPGNTPPLVTLTSPPDGAVFLLGSDISIEADASDPDGAVQRVELFVGTTKLGEVLTPPYSFLWQSPPEGHYTLQAVAFDDDGAVRSSATNEIVVSAGGLPPAVAITTPADGTAVSAGTDLRIEVDASDPDGNVALVELFLGAEKLGEAPSAPYFFDWAGVPAGNHVLTAVAVDDGGGRTTSEPVSVSAFDPTGSSTVVIQEGLEGYSGSSDTFLDVWRTPKSFGASTSLLDKEDKLSVLVRFAVFRSEGGPIPDGVTIESAVLSLYKHSSYDFTYRADRMLRDWSEEEATWLLARSDAPWDAPGASSPGVDLEPDPEAVGSVGWDPGWLDIDVTGAVRGWGEGRPNHGWRLVPIAGNRNIKRFHSREELGEVQLRPKLTVVFSLDGSSP